MHLLYTSARQQLAVLVLLVVIAFSNASELFIPEKPLKVDTWTNASAPWFEYPETSPDSNYYLPRIGERPSFGVAVSGGGYRAATLALGYVRALHRLGVLDKARFLSSNSGGSWFNAAFSYQRLMKLDEFLGPYFPPKELTMANLASVEDKKHGAFAATIANATIRLAATKGGLARAFAGIDVTRLGGWSEAIGAAFLAPYNLTASHSTISAKGTKGPIHTAAAQLGLETYYYQGATDKLSPTGQPRPFPIIVASMRQSQESLAGFHPIEFTPEYIGIPPVTEAEVPSDVIGGGMVEPVGFNSEQPDPVPILPQGLTKNASSKVVSALHGATPGRRLLQASNSSSANSTGGSAALPGSTSGRQGASGPSAASMGGQRPAAAAISPADAALNRLLPIKATVKSTGIMPLTGIAGMSSAAFAQALGMLPGQAASALKAFVGTERVNYWNQVNFQGDRRDFTDGAATDNYAVTPLLRRKVKNIIVCIANSEPISGDINIDAFASKEYGISGLFGAVPKLATTLKAATGMEADKVNEQMQVFPREGWEAFYRGLIQSTDNGGPTYHLAEYEVQANPHVAVQGGWKVRVLWVVNAHQTAWEKQLPTDVAAMIDAARPRKSRAQRTTEATSKDAAAKSDAERAKLGDYPYIKTTNADYSPELTGLLSQQASWQMMQLKDQINQMMEGKQITQPAAFSSAGTERSKYKSTAHSTRAAPMAAQLAALAAMLFAVML